MVQNQQTNQFQTEKDIHNLMYSAAYRVASHPDYALARNTVNGWYARQYGTDSTRMDAAGKTVTPTPKSPWNSLGDVLFVGEGNLSFALSVARSPNIATSKITATTFEKEKDLSEETRQNADKLRRIGSTINYGVDATNLDKIYPHASFDTIIFQFPNVGSREPVYGHNPNHVLIRNFLKNAAECLRLGGKVIISAVDSPHYRGAFQFDEAAKRAGFKVPVVYPFDPSKFPGYNHTNTNDDTSALENHDQFSTWVFTLKG